MKHKHASLIKRWAEDTDLVILTQSTKGIWCVSIRQKRPRWDEDREYFLVPAEHAEVALHFLNGGEIEMYSDSKECWVKIDPEITPNFSSNFKYRIKSEFEPEEGNWYLAYIDLTSAWVVVQYVDGGFYDKSDKRFPKTCLELKNKVILGELDE